MKFLVLCIFSPFISKILSTYLVLVNYEIGLFLKYTTLAAPQIIIIVVVVIGRRIIIIIIFNF